jgi:hypothetical protein
MRGWRDVRFRSERPFVRNPTSQQVQRNVAARSGGSRLDLRWWSRPLVGNATSQQIERRIALSVRTTQDEEPKLLLQVMQTAV